MDITAERMDITEKEARRALEDAIKNARTNAADAMNTAIAAQTQAATVARTNAENAMKNDYNQAERYLLNLKQKDYLSPVINFNLANTYKMKKDYDSAIKLFNEYIGFA
jgi:vacuolar-type H+-ATPase subunit E/Vma4